MALTTKTGTQHLSTTAQTPGANILVPDAAMLFTGDYSRSGHDLVLTGPDGAKLVLEGYFSIVPDPGTDNVGSYKLFSLGTGLAIGTVNSVGTKWVVRADGQIAEFEKTLEEEQLDINAINQLNAVFTQWQSSTQGVPEAGEKGTEGGKNSGDSGGNSFTQIATLSGIVTSDTVTITFNVDNLGTTTETLSVV